MKQINLVLANGLAAEKFEKMIHALGGSASFLSTYKKELHSSLYVDEIFLKKSGWLKEINTRKLGLLLIELGGGRKKIDDKINYHVGYNNILGIGEKVDEKKPIIKVFSSSEVVYNNLKNEIKDCFILSDNEITKPTNIYKVIK